jgi:hypothetical protein
MVILPGSTIILDDNILSLSHYIEEFPDVLWTFRRYCKRCN